MKGFIPTCLLLFALLGVGPETAVKQYRYKIEEVLPHNTEIGRADV